MSAKSQDDNDELQPGEMPLFLAKEWTLGEAPDDPDLVLIAGRDEQGGAALVFQKREAIEMARQLIEFCAPRRGPKQ